MNFLSNPALTVYLPRIIAIGFFGFACERPMEPADLVLLNGKILTVNEEQPEAEALASRGDTIVALGSISEIRQYVGEETEVIDLEGYLAIPGFIEGHGHYYSQGASLMELELRYTNSWAEIVSLVAQAAREARPGEWIVGRGWHQDKWDRTPEPNIEGLPFHHELSAVSPDNPVFLSHTSGHGVFVNALAMEVAGITSRSVDPPGGEIVRDDNGDPVGMLRESASQPARDALAHCACRKHNRAPLPPLSHSQAPHTNPHRQDPKAFA